MTHGSDHYTAQPLPPRGGHPGAWGPGAGAPRNVTVNVVGGKSLLISYLLWFFLGSFGIHKFYLLQPFQGIFYLLLAGFGWLTTPIVIGWFPLALWALLMVIDIFTMPIRVGVLNARLAHRVNGY